MLPQGDLMRKSLLPLGLRRAAQATGGLLTHRNVQRSLLLQLSPQEMSQALQLCSDVFPRNSCLAPWPLQFSFSSRERRIICLSSVWAMTHSEGRAKQNSLQRVYTLLPFLREPQSLFRASNMLQNVSVT